MNPYQQRRLLLQESIEPQSILLLHSGRAKHKSYDEYYPFYPNMNMYYFTGLTESNCVLMMVKEDKETKEFLFIEETTEHMALWLGEKISKQEASFVSGIDVKHILYISQLESFFHNIIHHSKQDLGKVPSRLYLDLFEFNKETKSSASIHFINQMTKYPMLQLEDCTPLITTLRMQKDAAEIAHLQTAIDITNKGLTRILTEMKSRDYEYQLEADFLHQTRLEGATELSFKTIAASGINATVLHYEENSSPLQKGDLILFDLGAKSEYYSADISRTYPINGTFTKRQKDIYEVVLKANKETIKAVKPGVTWTELNNIAKTILEDGAKQLGILKEHESIAKYYYHSVGHYLGLDTHDVGFYGSPLQEGMVITIEPGLYIKEERIGIRIEDNIVVTKDGYRNLSKNIIKEIEDIEQALKSE